ncbi:hypothetical protein [Streptomyces sp. NBC_01689]|uniref:hypothetical protein n=1 Tax=Streptomyces sp. NBC_01689 TaxID=2975911 RepID=UPI002E3154A1|nr:hypothetical protein [Streptomyces sp. NBC_01689]
MRRKRNLWLDRARYRRVADADDAFLTAQQTVELLLRGYVEGHVTVDLPESRGQQPDRGRVVVPLPDDVFARAESAVGERRISLLLDTLIAAYLDGTVMLALSATDARRAPKQPTLTLVPPGEAQNGEG